jgi:AraC-like DNA-binding protein
MPDEPLLVPLTAGVPFYSLRHGCSVWTPGQKPSFMIYDDWDLLWVQRGAMTVAFKDGRRLIADSDQFVVLPPFTPVTVGIAKPGVILAFCHFSFRIPPRLGLSEQDVRAGIEADLLGPGHTALVPVHFTRGEAPGVWQAYRALMELRPPRPGSAWRIERGLLALVSELAAFGERRSRAHESGVVLSPARVDPRLESVRARIVADPATPWRISALAASVGLSASQLHRMHTAAFGSSLKEHIIDTRLQRSIRLLRERRDGRPPSIREVSEACGFSSQHFFSRQFKSRFRIGPLAFRNGEMSS